MNLQSFKLNSMNSYSNRNFCPAKSSPMLRFKGEPQSDEFKFTSSELQTGESLMPTNLIKGIKPKWGEYTNLDKGQCDDGNKYKIKMLKVDPHKELSLQKHDKRAENWVVVQGNPTFVCGNTSKEYSPTNTLFIPQGVLHQIKNNSDQRAVILELQRGPEVSETDIHRYTRNPDNITLTEY